MRAAAVLGVLVKAEGIAKTNAQLTTTQRALEKTEVKSVAASAGLERIGRHGKTAGSGLMTAAKGMGKFVAAYAGFKGIEKSISTTDDLGHSVLLLHKNFGLTVQTAARWAAVTRARGIDPKPLAMGFKTLSTQTLAAQQGSKSALKQFQELGITQQQLTKHGGDLNYMLARVSDGLSKMPAGTQRAALTSKFFGRSWQALSPLLRDGSKAMDGQLKLADKYGATVGGKTVKSVEDLIVAQREAKLASMGLQVTIGSTLIPVLTKAIGAVAGFVAQFRAGKGAGGQLRDAVMSVWKVLAPFVETVKLAAHWLGEHEKAAKVLIPILGGLATAIYLVNTAMNANPITRFVTVLVLLGVALATAYRKCKTFRDVVDAVFGFVKGAVQTLAAVFTTVFPVIVKAVTNAWNTIKQVTSVVWDAIKPIVTAALKAIVAVIRVYVAIYKAVLTAAWEVIKVAARIAWGLIKMAILRPMQALVGALKAVWTVIRVAAKPAWDAVKFAIVKPIQVAAGLLAGLWNTIAAVAKAGWLVVSTLAKTAWLAIKTTIVAPIKAAAAVLDGLWTRIKTAATDTWSAIIRGISGFASGLKDGVVNGIRDGLNLIIDFLNKIIGVVNHLPFVNIKKIGRIGGDAKKDNGGNTFGGGNIGGTQQHGGAAMAQGGAFKRTQGMVRKPITLMGEEAPAHPEFVIPTNPAYRKRAQGLVGQAAKAVGLAKGGMYSQQQMADLWKSEGGPQPAIAGAVGMAESGGNSQIVNSIGATGLWQIHPGGAKYLDPVANALAGIAKYKDSLARKGNGWLPWQAYTGPDGVGSDGPWRQFFGGKGGGGGASGQQYKAEDYIKKLPKGNGIPDWLSMFGQSLGGGAPGFIRGKVNYANTLNGNLDYGKSGGQKGSTKAVVGGTSGPKGVGNFAGVPMADWVMESLKHAQKKGVDVRPTSGYRPGRDPHTASGMSEHQGTQYPHGAVDFGGFHDAGAKAMKMAVVAATADFQWPLLAPIGFVDDGHASGTGHKKGGLFGGMAGAYAKGGAFARTAPPVPTASASRSLHGPSQGLVTGSGTFKQLYNAIWAAMRGGVGAKGMAAPPYVIDNADNNAGDYYPGTGVIHISKKWTLDALREPGYLYDYAFNTIIHEMVHARQKSGLLLQGTKREVEGGAVAYSHEIAGRVASRIGASKFGGDMTEAPEYERYGKWVRKHLGEAWVDKGQFGLKAHKKTAKAKTKTGGKPQAIVQQKPKVPGKVKGAVTKGKNVLGPTGQNNVTPGDATAKFGGGKSPTKPTSTKPFKMPKTFAAQLKAIKTGKSPKVRKQVIAGVHNAIKGLDLPGSMTRRMDKLGLDSDTYSEYAARAGDLTDEQAITDALTAQFNMLRAASPFANLETMTADQVKQVFPESDQAALVASMLGRFGPDNLTQFEWLQKQLQAMFEWRNTIIAALPIIAKKRQDAIEMLATARAQLATVTAQMATATVRKGNLIGERTDLVNQLAKAKGKPKKNHDRIVALKAQIGTLDEQIIGIDKKQSGRQRLVNALSGTGGIIDSLVQRRNDLQTRSDDLSGSNGLSGLQGLGGPMDWMAALPPLGVLGGDIFSVQQTAQNLAGATAKLRITDDTGNPNAAATATTTDPGMTQLVADLAQLLHDANLRTAVSQAQFNVFRNMPDFSKGIPFGGQFASGGVVPGMAGAPTMILAHGGETVTPVGGAGAVVHVHVDPAMAFLKKFIRVEVEGGTRAQARSVRTLPGRPGTL